MTLGILRVAAALEAAGHQVEMLDLSGIENYEEVTRRHAEQTSARVFGLTATTPQMPAAFKVTQSLRSVRSDARIILGGPHITLINAARKGEIKRGTLGRATAAMDIMISTFDTLVAGDGEDSIFHALEETAPKMIDADDANSSLFLSNQRLNELPLPARHLLDASSYHYTIEGISAMSLIAQLGCPFHCGFCGGRESPMLRRVRTRSTTKVLEEIIHLHDNYGVNGFMLYDDELNINTKMIELMDQITTAQKTRGVEWRLRGFVKSELFTDAQAAAMHRAGFRWILTGFESGSPRILRNIEKKATREENSRCVAIAKRNGLKVKALMSIGHPGESRDTVLETRDWLLESKPDDFDVTIITTYPGTPYYDRALPHPEVPGVWIYTYPGNGDRLYSYEVDYTRVADYYKGDPDGGYKAYVYTDHLSAEDLVRLRDQVEREVRETLSIPFNPGRPAQRFEHSMGQLPSNILRRSKALTTS